jgi:hypothetical protein
MVTPLVATGRAGLVVIWATAKFPVKRKNTANKRKRVFVFMT